MVQMTNVAQPATIKLFTNVLEGIVRLYGQSKSPNRVYFCRSDL